MPLVGAVDAVDLGVLGNTHEQRVLPAGAGSDDLLAADGGVIDLRRLLNVVDGALPSLVVAGEAPRVDLAVGGDGEAVIEASLDLDYIRYV